MVHVIAAVMFLPTKICTQYDNFGKPHVISHLEGQIHGGSGLVDRFRDVA